MRRDLDWFRRGLRLVLVNSLSMRHWFPKGARLTVLRRVGYDVGEAHLLSDSIIRCTSLTIGDGSFVNHRCLFDIGDLYIGVNVFISSGVTLAMGDHELGSGSQRAGKNIARPIRIEDGSWLGANVVVLGGVTVARGCVIGAGAVVTRDTEADGVYVGVPARRIRDLD